jgi:hypothetical protein
MLSCVPTLLRWIPVEIRHRGTVAMGTSLRLTS